MPGSPDRELGNQGPLPVTEKAVEPSGRARAWKDPVAARVIDLPVSRLVKVSLLPGKTPKSLTGFPALSVKVVLISSPSM